MSVNFYDVNFNQPGDNSIPAISGYIISDEAYQNRVSLEGKISESDIISKAQSTSNILGAVSMDRYLYRAEDTDHNPISFMTCRLQPDGGYVIRQRNEENAVYIEIWQETGVVTDHPDASLGLSLLNNYNNISLVGHFDANDELDWVSIGYMYQDEDTNESKLYINTDGFSSTIKDLMKPYVYLKYKYEYQVVIQKSLRGTDNFQLCRIDVSDRKIYGTGEGQSQKFSEVVIPAAQRTTYTHDVDAAWWRYPPVSTASQWWQNYTVNTLSLNYGAGWEDAVGSDITRLLPDGKFYNGLDCDNNNLAWTDTSSSYFHPYDIDFTGGKIRLTFVGSFRYVQILDDQNQVLDQWQMPYPVSGGGSSIPTGEVGGFAMGNYGSLGHLYLAEHNNHYYLISCQRRDPWLDDENQPIILDSPVYGTYSTGIAFQVVHKFNNEANNLLYSATDSERIVPADPDSLTSDETSNQTSDPDNKNELGNEIPHPDYNDGDWGDGSNDGIRGSGNGQQTGGNFEGKLDQQPGLPDLPNIPTGVSTGFVKMLAPTDAQIQAFCQEITDDSALNALKQFFTNNPLDFITSLHVVPGTYTQAQNAVKLKYGGYESDVAMIPITQEYTEIDYGELQLKEIYGSWEDYNPHTKMSIYLPYIGIKDIDVDRIQGSKLKLKYLVSASTGSILAFLTSVRVDNRNKGAEILVGQWAGCAKYTIPLTSVQHDAAVNAALSIVAAAVSVGAAVASAGASTAVTAASAAAIGSTIGNAALSGAHAGKVDVTMQGSVSGDMAFFTAPDAYIQIEAPIEGRPISYDHIIGMPSNITTDLAHQPMNNYIEFANIDVSGIDAPADEKQMIVDMLKGGIYT